MTAVLQFTVNGQPVHEEIEADVTLAIYAAECSFGKPRVRLETAYAVKRGGRTCVVETTGEAGEAAARILAGLLATRYGEAGYRVKRIERATAVAR